MLTDESTEQETAAGPVPSDSTPRQLAKQDKTARKMERRRNSWQWNHRLLLVSIAVIVVVGTLSTASYFYHSATTASTFLSRAQQAAEQEDFAEQVKWLRRYSLLKPDDIAAIAEVALAADEAVEAADPSARAAAANAARRLLSESVARLGQDEENAEIVRDLRERLIERLLQLGGTWLREAERQVVLLGAEPDDAEATRWLALSLSRQVSISLYKNRESDKYQKKDGYWRWLSNQKPGEVLALAVDRNPQDLDLIANFLQAYQNPAELFDEDRDDPGSRLAELKASVQQRLTTLRSNPDSRSKLILYRFESSGGRGPSANEALISAAEEVSQRLAKRAKSHPDDAAQADDAPESSATDWDYILVAEAALQLKDSEPKRAMRLYETLLALQDPSVPVSTIAHVYFRGGNVQQNLGDRQRAIEIWERGVNDVDPDNLDLLGALAWVRGLNESDEAAPKALDQYREAVQQARRDLARATRAELSRAARTQASSRLATDRWRIDVLEALLAVRDDRRIAAIQHLQDAMDNDADVLAEMRVWVARRLSELYGRNGMWDQAAAALDRAVAASPGDIQLRSEAAQAWVRTGNWQRAAENWRIIGNSESVLLQVESAQALYIHELRQLPEQRDFSRVRSAVDRLRKQLADQAEASRGTARGGADAMGRLRVLEICLPPAGVSAEAHMKSAAWADKLASLAAEYPTEPTIQAFAAEKLAAVGSEQQYLQALERLSALVGPTHSSLVIVQARAEATNGDYLAASQRLIQQAELDPRVAGTLLRLAAEIAAQESDPNLAYDVLNSIPEENRTLDILFAMANLAMRLPESSTVMTGDGTEVTPPQLRVRLEDQLRQLEGEQGSFWRFLKLARIVDELNREQQRIERSDGRLREARKLAQELLKRRRNWGAAIALDGRLLAIEGKPEQAVGQLERGIAAGDQSLQTRRILWGQLIKLNRYAEVEEDIRRAALRSTAPLDQYSATRIQLVLRQGDYGRSLEIAEAGVRERPNDFLSHVVMCLTASIVAESTQDREERFELLERARTAIDQADALTERDEPSVYSARLKLLLMQGDQEAIRGEIERIVESGLTEIIKLRLMSQAHIGLADYDAALPLLQKADQLQASTQSALALAEHYRRMRRQDDEIAALRMAHQRSPENAELRNQLAAALVARDGEDVNWDEVSRLLADVGSQGKNRLYLALLLAARGSEAQKSEAEQVLRELRVERNSLSIDASRALAALLATRARELEPDDSRRQKYFDEVRNIYDSLTSTSPAHTVDLFRYAAFLLNHGNEADFTKVEDIRRQLGLTREGVVAALSIAVRHARKTGGQNAVRDAVQNWADEVSRRNLLSDDQVAAIAGSTLLELELTQAALEWFERAYRNNPDSLIAYVGALRKAGEIEKSISVAANHFQIHSDPISVTLLVDLLIVQADVSAIPVHQQAIDLALENFADQPQFLESVATLRLVEERLDEAIALYEQIQKLDPLRIRTLNNLAMALSESPGRAAEGLNPIERAITIAGEQPELLDTKGVVLLKAGRFQEAQDVFRQAWERANNPRYKFHLIMTLLAQEKNDEALLAWKDLNLNELDPAGLTPSEEEVLNDLKNRYGN